MYEYHTGGRNPTMAEDHGTVLRTSTAVAYMYEYM